MPKKTRREKLRASRRPMNVPAAPPAPTSQAPQTAVERAAPVGTAPVTGSRSPVASRALTFDYTYVYRDLRRIAILAATFFILLIVLSFVIR